MAAERGYATDDAKARLLGVPPSVISKLRRRKQRLSSDFIASVLAAFPAFRFEKFFELADGDDT